MINSNQNKLKKQRNISLFFLGLTAVINGMVAGILIHRSNDTTLASICFTLVAIALIYYWIYYDAQVRNYRIPKIIKYLVILISILGVPIYFWKTRTFKDFCFNLGGLWIYIYYYFISQLALYFTVTK